MPFAWSKKAQQVIDSNKAMLAEFATINATTLAGYITVVAELDPVTGELGVTVNSGGNLAVRQAMMQGLAEHGPLNPNTNVVEKFGDSKKEH